MISTRHIACSITNKYKACAVVATTTTQVQSLPATHAMVRKGLLGLDISGQHATSSINLIALRCRAHQCLAMPCALREAVGPTPPTCS